MDDARTQNGASLGQPHESDKLAIPADLIIIDRDILSCPIDDIRDTLVLQTYLDGRLV
jgi:predicted amidohydrolase YtcJ